MLNVVFQRMEAGSTHVVVPPIVVSDVLGLPPADASNMSAFVQQFLADVIASVDPFGMVAQEIQQVRPAGCERCLLGGCLSAIDIDIHSCLHLFLWLHSSG